MRTSIVGLATLISAAVLAEIFGVKAARLRHLDSDWTPTTVGLSVYGSTNVVISPGSRDQPLDHEFVLKNSQPYAIEITKVECGCSCMASQLQKSAVGPGEAVHLRVRINSFDAYKARYREYVRVLTDHGDLELNISGELPLPNQVLYRPQVLYLATVPGAPMIRREISIRIPKHWRTAIDRSNVRHTCNADIELQVVEEPETELYREFVVKVGLALRPGQSVNGMLEIDSGKSPIRIPLRTLNGDAQ